MNLFCDEKEYGDDYDAVFKLCQLKKNDLFIDIGANLGQEIEYFSDQGLRVDSWEPHPELYKHLQLKYEACENVTLNNAAVFDSNSNKTLYFREDPHERIGKMGTPHGFVKNEVWNDIGSTLIPEKQGISGMWGCEVQCVDIVDIIKKADNQVKILKIDVEGAEYHILRRLIETNLIHVPEFVFFEDHARKVNTLEFSENKNFVQDFVASTNFKFYIW